MKLHDASNLISCSFCQHLCAKINQRLFRATSWFELFAPLSSWVTCNLAFFAKFIPLFVGYTCQQNCYVCKKGLPRLSSKRELLLRKKIVIATQKGNWHFFEIRNIVNQQKTGNLLIFAIGIFSYDTIRCGRQIVLFFGQNCCCSRDMWNTIIHFLKKRLLLFKKHFETGMLMSPKNIFILCHSLLAQIP